MAADDALLDALFEPDLAVGSSDAAGGLRPEPATSDEEAPVDGHDEAAESVEARHARARACCCAVAGSARGCTQRGARARGRAPVAASGAGGHCAGRARRRRRGDCEPRGGRAADASAREPLQQPGAGAWGGALAGAGQRRLAGSGCCNCWRPFFGRPCGSAPGRAILRGPGTCSTVPLSWASRRARR
jgi:hypothetical protein